jgi:hypothetical protein
MAAKRRSARKRRVADSQPRGVRGPRGKTGATGPKGPPGNHSREIARLSAQMDQIVKELQTQLTRIAQIQGQLERIVSKDAAKERPWSGEERRAREVN